MDYNEAIYRRNLDKLKANNLSLNWSLDLDPLINVDISTIQGDVVLSDYIDKHELNNWLGDNVNKAICLSKSNQDLSSVHNEILIFNSWTDYFINNPQHEESIKELVKKKVESDLKLNNIPELRSANLSPFGNYLLSLLVNELNSN